MKIIQILIALFISITLTTQICAQDDLKKISVQGLLKDANGNTMPDGSYEITFRIYDADKGGSIIWKGTETVNVYGGIYSTHIANGEDPTTATTLEIENLPWDKPYFVSLEINNNGVELKPRTALTYAPYAFAVNFALSTMVAEEIAPNGCSGAVGDIKYSILAPAQFAKVNGECWVPMDGQQNLANTRLKALLDKMPNGNYGSNSVPDISGLFIRSHEFDGSTQNYDPIRSPTDPIAQLQQDDMEAHTHSMTSAGAHSHSVSAQRAAVSADLVGTESNDKYLAVSGSSFTSSTGAHTHDINEDSNGAVQARPENLSLYTYIRIN